MQTRVIGAGTAGFAAVRAPRGTPQTAEVLEARERIGGRGFTNRTFLATSVRPHTPVESGAEFIHDTAPT
jgi:monoamine oxidase